MFSSFFCYSFPFKPSVLFSSVSQIVNVYRNSNYVTVCYYCCWHTRGKKSTINSFPFLPNLACQFKTKSLEYLIRCPVLASFWFKPVTETIMRCPFKKLFKHDVFESAENKISISVNWLLVVVVEKFLCVVY